MTLGTVKAPTPDELREVAADLGLSFSDDDLAQHLAALLPSIAAFNIIDRMPDDKPRVTYPRTAGYRPSAEENAHGAWYVKTTVQGAASRQAQGQEGRAQGQRVPRRRADDERRIDAGRLHARCRRDRCDPHSRRRGHDRRQGGLRIFLLLRRQPHQFHRAGPQPASHGLFGWRFVLGQRVAWSRSGKCEMALGGDQGGSIRIPSAFCGVYGMKPTHGLVPYTGIMPIELTIDHIGPMTADGRGQCAPARSAGRDRTGSIHVNTAGSRNLIGRRSAAGFRGFASAWSRRALDTRSRCRRWMRSFARLLSGSREWARRSKTYRSRCICSASPIWLSVAAEGATVQMMQGNGFGFNWQGLYLTSLMDFHSNWRMRADELSDTLKNTMLLGHYMTKHYRGHYYAKGQNLVRRLRAAYDDALAACDLLLMPTLADGGDEAARGERAYQRDFAARLRNAAEYGSVRLYPPPGNERAVRSRRRTAGGNDVGRSPIRRRHHLSGRSRVRGQGSVEVPDGLIKKGVAAALSHRGGRLPA